MNDKVLLAYASRYGSTAGIAEKIADVLRAAGHEVDLRPVGQVGGLDSYSAVILGSAVYYGSWRKEAEKFLISQSEALQGKKVWFFSSGPAGEGDPVELLEGWTFPSNLQETADKIQPRGTAVFHGVMDEKKMNFLERFILKRMGAPLGDFRDWGQITNWAEEIVQELN